MTRSPGEVFLRVAADAAPADPVPLEGMRERFLAGCSFRGRERSKLQYAILAAAAISGGAERDLLDEVASMAFASRFTLSPAPTVGAHVTRSPTRSAARSLPQ